jgi:hypothetical protein
MKQDFAETYCRFSDDEIATLHAQIGSLTDDARVALETEIRRRGLKQEQLSKLDAAERRHEAHCDRLEKIHRRRVASYILFRNDPKGTIMAFLAIVLGLSVLALIDYLRH